MFHYSTYYIPDLVEIQRKSFFDFLEKGISEEFAKINPITDSENQIEIFFYPEYYRLTKPFYSIEQAIFYKKSYVSKFYVPVQLTDRKKKRIYLKWVLLAHFPLMTNRGHFVLNGSARVIINQLVRSPGIYFRENIHEIYSTKWSEKPSSTFRRFYADIICLKGTWLRLESEKDFSLWAKMKKGPKIPLFWFLLGMGLSEKYIFHSVSKPLQLLESFSKELEKSEKGRAGKVLKYPYLSTSKKVWEEIQKLLKLKRNFQKFKKKSSFSSTDFQIDQNTLKNQNFFLQKVESEELGRRWFSNKFMNPRTYDLGRYGRELINKKLGLSIPSDQTTLTGLDILGATDFLMKMQDRFADVDDIDHLKNKRIRTAGESIQEVFSLGLFRLEKSIRLKFSSNFQNQKNQSKETFASRFEQHSLILNGPFFFNSFFSTRPINGVFREFFGTHPLSQFMDQINPLSEMTHKRRLTSLGPGGVSRDTATLAIRGIHPSHYGRICPIETPEGKNTGLVNSITTYAKLSSQGFLESPFYKVVKGQAQKDNGIFFLNPEKEEHFQIATPDIQLTALNFFPKKSIPVRVGKRFVRMQTKKLSLIGVSPLQMISIATSFIPFLEHDDANRALMGSNMQRQAVPLLKVERPFLGTGLETRLISDGGQALRARKSGYILYISAEKILLYS
jgi:DNA-directed RNA polymerase subunit beta